jgi:hypothetical protein
MRHLLVAFTCLAVFAMSGPLIARPVRDSAVEKAGAALLWGDPSTWQSNSEIQRVALGNDVFVERLHGEAALAHLYNLMSRRPEAFAAARKSLEQRGFAPTNIVTVERTIRLARSRPKEGGALAVPAQTSSEQNSDGEIVFWSWDDGNNGTWEGEIYIEIYSTGAASTWEGQIDDSTDQYPWIYYRKLWEGAGGGGPHEVQNEVSPPLPGSRAQIVPAVLLESCGLEAGRVVPVSFYQWAVCWRACVLGGCTAAAAWCRLTGPAWPECWSVRCVAAEIGCAVSCYFAN